MHPQNWGLGGIPREYANPSIDAKTGGCKCLSSSRDFGGQTSQVGEGFGKTLKVSINHRDNHGLLLSY